MERYKKRDEVLSNFSGRGEIYSWTVIPNADVAPAGFGPYAPYAVALVRLEEGPLVMTMLTDMDLKKIEIGMQVEMVTRKIKENGEKGLIVYGYKFRPPLVRN